MSAIDEPCPECGVGTVVHVSHLPDRTRYVCTVCSWDA